MDKKEVFNIIEWIKEYFKKSSSAKGVVIGMSGGKDSFVVAKLCTEALGKENVLGVIMPNNQMTDFDDAKISCEILGINYTTIDIANSYNSILDSIQPYLQQNNIALNSVSTINTAPRIRMTTLYALASSLNYLVANTSNLSEAEVGYTTKWGDNVGDFAPIANFTKSEVCEIGLLLGLPKQLINKIPSDGLSNKSDEEKLGFSYDELDTFIRTGIKGKKFDTILSKNISSSHKRNGVIKYENNLKNYFNKRK